MAHVPSDANDLSGAELRVLEALLSKALSAPLGRRHVSSGGRGKLYATDLGRALLAVRDELQARGLQVTDEAGPPAGDPRVERACYAARRKWKDSGDPVWAYVEAALAWVGGGTNIEPHIVAVLEQTDGADPGAGKQG